MIYNRTLGTSYTDMVTCFGAISDGATNVLLEIDADHTASAIAVFNKNITGLTIRGIGGTPTLDCNQFDSFMSFNGTSKTLNNVTIDNLRFINNNTVTTNAAAIRFTTVGGNNFLTRLTFNGCSIPVRATTGCGAFTCEDCIARNYTLAVFRFGLGATTGILPGVQDMGAMVFRRCQFYAGSNASTEADLVLKRMPSLLVEDCQFYTPAKFAVDVYDQVTGGTTTIRRCLFQGGHAKASSGGTINVSPNVTTGSGTAENLLVESCVFDGEKGQAISTVTTTGLKVRNNLFIEGVGNAGNMVSLTTSSNFTEHYGNIYTCNTTNTNPIVNVGTCSYASGQLNSDYNLYYKTTARGLLAGTTTGGTQPQAISGSTLAAIQAKGYDAHGLNTQPVFNTTDKKKDPYYLTPASPGRLGGSPSFPPSPTPALGNLIGSVYDMGPKSLRSYRYRTNRYRITKSV